jgi:hypothetical protein
VADLVKCPSCGQEPPHHIQREETPPPHWAKLVCCKCGAVIRWLGKPMTQERAAAFRIPWPRSKYAGKRLDEVPRSYLEWLAGEWAKEDPPGSGENNSNRTIRRAVQYFLGPSAAISPQETPEEPEDRIPEETDNAPW